MNTSVADLGPTEVSIVWLLGLKWEDIDFDRRELTVRRSLGMQGLSTPKSGKSRKVPLSDAIAAELFNVLTARRQEGLHRGWSSSPEWVFCTEVGTAPQPRNVERVWYRVRRRAQALGVRPLRLHCTRHTWATMALQAGRSNRAGW